MKKKRDKVATGSSRLIKSGMTRTNISTRNFTSYYLASAIAFITLVVYMPALQNGFVNGWDDAQYVLDNAYVHSLRWSSIKWALTDTSVALYWHPLTWISHALDYTLWGANPLGHHLTSVVLHAINTATVVFLTIRLLECVNENELENSAKALLNRPAILMISGVTGILFGIHPLRVESVAWVAMRKDLLYAFFYLLSILSYIRSVRRDENGEKPFFYLNRRYYVSLLLFFLALCSKPMAVTLPATLLLLDWYPLKRLNFKVNFITLLLEKIPFILLSCIISAVSITAQNSAVGLKTFTEATFTTRMLVVFKALALYLWKIIAPINLLPLYPYPKDASITKPEYLLAILLIAAIASGCLFAAKKSRLPAALFAFFIISLFPVIGFFQTGGQFMADRHVYLAGIGPFILLGTVLSLAWERANIRQKWIIATAALSLALFLSFATIRQIRFWQNAITLWSYYIEKEGTRYPDVYYDRAVEYKREGKVDLAIDDYNTAITINPKFGTAYINRGVIFQLKGLYEQAVADFNKAIILEPYSVDARINLGNTYHKMGKSELAIEEYNQAISKKPTLPVPYINRGVVYKERGDNNRAIEDFSKALSLQPDLVPIYLVRGDLYKKSGIIDLALRDYKNACELGSESGCQKQSLIFQIPTQSLPNAK